MMTRKEIIKAIENALVRKESEFIISNFEFEQSFENQLLFFFKPECFFKGNAPELRNLVDMTLKKFIRFDVEISGILLLDGKHLEKLSIMDRHYGFINKLSRESSKILSKKELDQVQDSLGIEDISGYQVIGGHEFLKQHAGFNEESLNELWMTKKSIKLRSGFYLQEYAINGKKIILINGFHPSQLRHYTHPLHKIVVLLLHSNTNWKILKNDLAGDTFPERAKEDSIRGEIFKKRENYGLSNVSISSNCIHLSAGPFEALFEINNFLKNIKGIKFNLGCTNIARLINEKEKGMKEEETERCLLNPTTEINGTSTDLFTFSEEKDTSKAVSDFCEFFLNK
jgi:hypothetical protein